MHCIAHYELVSSKYQAPYSARPAPRGGAIGGAHDGCLPTQARGGAQVVCANHHNRHSRQVAHKRVAVLKPPQQVAGLVTCVLQSGQERRLLKQADNQRLLQAQQTCDQIQ